MSQTPGRAPRRRNPRSPKPVAKRGRKNKQYHSREERAMFQLGNRAALKEKD